MPDSPWQRRIRRAEELAGQHPFAAEILRFYVHVARFQEDLHRKLSVVLQSPVASADRELTAAELAELSSRFQSFLSLAEAHGPKTMAELSREIHAREGDGWSDLLQAGWIAHSSPSADGLLAQTFLQPYAELLRSRASLRPGSTAYALCPFCKRKPALAVLRQLGDGGARSMICSFCLAEWDFRRILCPACGEEDDKKLAIFTASEFDYIRLECCDACNTYVKNVDLTKNGHAEPLIDDFASAPLDLWAREHGYAKLQTNLVGI